MSFMDKTQLIQQSRFLSEQSTSNDTRCEILTALLWLYNTEGTSVMSDADLKRLFISLTKVLAMATPTTQILAMRCIHAILPRLDSALFIINSLCKIYDTQSPLQPMCLRLLAEASVSANVAEAGKMVRMAASDPRDSNLVSAAGFAASVLNISLYDQAVANCTAVKGPAGAFLASFVKTDKLAQVSNPYGQVVLIRRLSESKDVDDQKKVKMLSEYFPKQGAQASKYSGHSSASMSLVDQMAPLEAIKVVLLLPYHAYARKLRIIMQAITLYLSSSVGSVGRTVGLNLAHSLLKMCHMHDYFETFTHEMAQSDAVIFNLLSTIETMINSASQSVAALAGQVLLEFNCWIAGTPFSTEYNAVKDAGKGSNLSSILDAVVELLPTVNSTLRTGIFTALSEHAKLYPQNVSSVLPTLSRFLELNDTALRTQIFDLLVDFAENYSKKETSRAVELSTQSLHILLQLLEDSPSPLITKRVCNLVCDLDLKSHFFKSTFYGSETQAADETDTPTKDTIDKNAERVLLPIVCLLWNRARLEPASVRLVVIDSIYSLSVNASCPPAIRSECTRILRILANIAAINDEYTSEYILERLYKDQSAHGKHSAKKDEQTYVDVATILQQEDSVLRGDFSGVLFCSSLPRAQSDALLEYSKSQTVKMMSLEGKKFGKQGKKHAEADSTCLVNPLRSCLEHVRAAKILDDQELAQMDESVSKAEQARTLPDCLFTNGVWHPVVNASYDVRCDVSYLFLNTGKHKGVLVLISLGTTDKDLQIDTMQLTLMCRGEPVEYNKDSLQTKDVSYTSPATLRLWFACKDLKFDRMDDLLGSNAGGSIFTGTLRYDVGQMNDSIKLKPFGPEIFDTVSNLVSDETRGLRTHLAECKDSLSGLFQLPDMPTKEETAERLPSFFGLTPLESKEEGDKLSVLLGGQVFLRSAALVQCEVYAESKKVHLQVHAVGPSRDRIMGLMEQ